MCFTDCHLFRSYIGIVLVIWFIRGNNMIEAIRMGYGSYYTAILVLDGADPFVKGYRISCLVKSTYQDQHESHIRCVNGIFKDYFCLL